MHIVFLGATQRGVKFLQKLIDLCPGDKLTVFSFIEDPWEPRYLEDMKKKAADYGAIFFETKNVSAPPYQSVWDSQIDMVFMVSWRYLVPVDLLKNIRLGAIVFHDSLLPAYRGFSPVVWAMINGESHCGATMFHIADEVDSGDIIDQEKIEIGHVESISEVTDKVTEGYLEMLARNISSLKKGETKAIPQDHSQATYTCKRLPEDNLIDWKRSSLDIYNLIRAVTHPYPGAYTFYKGKKLFIWSASTQVPSRRYVGAITGRVVEIRKGEGVVVMTGDGALLVKTVQLEGELEIPASDLLKSIAASLG